MILLLTGLIWLSAYTLVGCIAAMLTYESKWIRSLPTERAKTTAQLGAGAIWPLLVLYGIGLGLWHSPKLVPLSWRVAKYLAGGVSDIKTAKPLGLPEARTVITKKP